MGIEIEGRLAYRPAELATMVGLSEKAIYRAVARGELEAARVANGTRLLIRAEAADEWLAGNAVPHGRSTQRRTARRLRSETRPLGDAFGSLRVPAER